MDGYELLDVGGGERLERFGARLVARPHPGALGPRRAPDRWAADDALLSFDRHAGWWSATGGAIDPWPIQLGDLTLELRPTAAGQVGLFPEHRLTLDWLRREVRARTTTESKPPTVLHLFAHTGLITLALAAAGAAVTHVDAARPSVAWARDNAARSGLADRPIRWIVDDAAAFVRREGRRRRRYDGLVLDPPSYGHGGRGGRNGRGGRGATAAWRIADDLPALLEDARPIVVPDGFVLLTAHTEALTAVELGRVLADAWRLPPDAVTTGELALTATSGARLPLGSFARWSGRR